MADFVYNVALWEIDRANWDDADAATIDVRSILWDALEADDAARDHDDVAAVIAATGTTEATATSYARYTHATQTRTVDDTNNRVDFDLDDAAFGAIGNGTNNTITDITTYDHETMDADSEPVSNHDAVFTTDGSSVTIQWNAAGVWRAAG